MVGAVLTQNTNWGNVEKAIANLKQAGCPPWPAERPAARPPGPAHPAGRLLQPQGRPPGQPAGHDQPALRGRPGVVLRPAHRSNAQAPVGGEGRGPGDRGQHHVSTRRTSRCSWSTPTPSASWAATAWPSRTWATSSCRRCSWTPCPGPGHVQRVPRPAGEGWARSAAKRPTPAATAARPRAGCPGWICEDGARWASQSLDPGKSLPTGAPAERAPEGRKGRGLYGPEEPASIWPPAKAPPSDGFEAITGRSARMTNFRSPRASRPSPRFLGSGGPRPDTRLQPVGRQPPSS